MIEDALQAQDDMFGMFDTAWKAADFDDYADDVPVIRYDGNEVNTPPSPDLPYVRIKISHVDGEQAALGIRPNRKRKYCKVGIISVQSFGPQGGGRGLEIATYMGIIAESVFQGKTSPNGVWFRRIRSTEVGPTGGWYQVNTIIDFEYNQVR